MSSTWKGLGGVLHIVSATCVNIIDVTVIIITPQKHSSVYSFQSQQLQYTVAL